MEGCCGYKPSKRGEEAKSNSTISLLSIFSKRFEELLIQIIEHLLEEKQIVPNHRFGFRQKHSTLEQVQLNEINKALDGKEHCTPEFLDISQAFDKDGEDGLFSKIKEVFPENIYTMLRHFIFNYRFEYTATCPIKSYAPQRSVLRLFAYLLYTFYVRTTAKSVTATFADDTAVLPIHQISQAASSRLPNNLN